jgi:hypothetical protein
MGLWSGKAQSILLGFYRANSTEELTYQGKRCVQKKEKGAGNKKKICQEAQIHLVFDSGACDIEKGRNPLQRRIKSTNDARRNIWSRFIHFLEPIPENFGYSLGGYSHRERSRHY